MQLSKAMRLPQELLPGFWKRKRSKRKRKLGPMEDLVTESVETESVEAYDSVPKEQHNETKVVEEILRLSDIFPGDIESVYQPQHSSVAHYHAIIRVPKRRNTGTTTYDGRTSTFFSLPRELRDEIYRYALPSDKVVKIKFRLNNPRQRQLLRQRLPTLWFAIPLLGEELLETYYRQIVFHLSATNGDVRRMSREWIRRHSEILR